MIDEKMNLDEILDHWERAARCFPKKGKITPTSRDPYLAELERENILNWLCSEHAVLELGPGDGTHTVHYAKKVKRLSALDISQGLVRLAQAQMRRAKICNVDLRVGSALNILDTYHADQFDRIISQRCLINLPKWRMQQTVIRQAHKVLRPGGLLLMSEGFQDGVVTLNVLREAGGLAPLGLASYNRLMIRADFEAFAQKLFDLVEVRAYGLYELLSRVFHPMVVFPKEPKHDSRLNEAAMKIARLATAPKLEQCSLNLFYVLRKS